MAYISQKLIDEIVEAIRSIIEPETIILFGSSIRDDFSQNSDIDIALVGINRERIYEIKDDINQSVHTLKDIDIICFEEITNRNLKKRILKEGRVIYERNTC